MLRKFKFGQNTTKIKFYMKTYINIDNISLNSYWVEKKFR